MEEKVLLHQCHLLTEKYYGKQVFLRGIIEFSNFCSQSCCYCGLRSENTSIPRYRLSIEEIIETVGRIYKDGIRSVVLQSGEDLFYTTSVIADLCSEIIRCYPDLAITLSIGERESPAYRKLRKAGASRFLMKHEIVNPILYRSYHPKQELITRLGAQQSIRKAGFILGSGFLIGLPGQTITDIYNEFLFLKQNRFDMWGIGLFIPADNTPLENTVIGNPSLVYRSMICSRIYEPQTMIPITTAYHSTVGDDATILALRDVANVYMINYTPDSVKHLYKIYNHKKSLSLEKTCDLIQKAGKKPTFTKGEPYRVNHQKYATSYWNTRTDQCR
jgi:biotin synthase